MRVRDGDSCYFKQHQIYKKERRREILTMKERLIIKGIGNYLCHRSLRQFYYS